MLVSSDKSKAWIKDSAEILLRFPGITGLTNLTLLALRMQGSVIRATRPR